MFYELVLSLFDPHASFKGWSALVLGIATLAFWRPFDGLPRPGFAILKNLPSRSYFPFGVVRREQVHEEIGHRFEPCVVITISATVFRVQSGFSPDEIKNG